MGRRKKLKGGNDLLAFTLFENVEKRVEDKGENKDKNSAISTAEEHIPVYLLFDGYNLAYRAFFAVPVPMLTLGGVVTTHLTLGYRIWKKTQEEVAKFLCKLGLSGSFYTARFVFDVDDFDNLDLFLLKEDKVRVVLDKVDFKSKDAAKADKKIIFIPLVFIEKGKLKRREMFELYKVQRKPMPSHLKKNLPLLWKLFLKLGVPCLGYDDREADDLMATFVMGGFNGYKFIISSDQDLNQLLGENVFQLEYKTNGEMKVKGVGEFLDEFGFEPSLLPDWKALVGDSSDNIPGIKGIGKKTASKLIVKFGSVEKIFENLASLPSKDRERLEGKLEEVLFYKRLIKLSVDDELLEAFRGLKWLEKLQFGSALDNEEGFNRKRLYEFCSRYELKSVAIGENLYRENDVEELAARLGRNVFDGKGIVDGESKVMWSLRNLGLGGKEYIRTGDLKVAFSIVFSKNVELEEVLKRFVLPAPWESRSDSDLLGKLLDRLEAYSWSNFSKIYNIEKNFSAALEKICDQSVVLDLEKLEELRVEFNDREKELERMIISELGNFNLSSPKQLREALFKKYAIKLKTTRADELEKWANLHPIIEKILIWRKVNKLKQIAQSLKDAAFFGQLKPEFVQFGTVTGRVVTKNPNLQNVPVKSEDGARFRELFVAPVGYKVLAADYSQIEMRLVARLAEDENLMRILEGEDVHSAVAEKLFGTKEKRDVAKAINYAIVYGQSPFGLARMLGVSLDEAKDIIDNFYANFPKVKDWHEELIYQAEKNLEVFSFYGRRAQIANFASVSNKVKEEAVNFVYNYPVQSTAADVFKMAVTELVNEGFIPVLLVHDEVVLYVRNEDMDDVERVKEIMENVVVDEFGVLPVNVSVAEFWD